MGDCYFSGAAGVGFLMGWGDCLVVKRCLYFVVRGMEEKMGWAVLREEGVGV